MKAPFPSRITGGWPPTALYALTGLLTPPGKTEQALRYPSSEFNDNSRMILMVPWLIEISNVF
jgi:hypothetical protein